MYVYVSMSLSDKVLKDHSCGGMIAYAGEWHDKVPSLMGNQVGRVVMIHQLNESSEIQGMLG